MTAIPGRGRSDDPYDRYARLLTRALAVPVAVVTLLEDGRHVLAGAAGLPDGWKTREVPLPQAMCTELAEAGSPLVVTDARVDPRMADHPATGLGVMAYAGLALVDPRGRTIGSICALDLQPRAWDDDELATLQDLAASLSATMSSQQGELLLALSEGLAATRTLAEVASTLQQVGVRELGCLRAAIWLDETLVSGAAEDPSELAPHRLVYVPDEHSTWEPAAQQPRIDVGSANPVMDAWRSRRPLFFGDLEELLAAYPGSPVRPESGQARAFLPLASRDRQFGTLVVMWADPHQIEADDRAVLTAMASYAGQAIDRALLLEERMEASRTLQTAMLTDLPQPDDLTLVARYLPASRREQVGGDWYDAVLLPSGCTALMIGDVVGHDLAAAADMGQLRNIVRALAWEVDDLPSATVTALDRALPGLGVDALCSLLLGRIEQTEEQRARGVRALRWTNAGHLPPLLADGSGAVRWLGEDADHDVLVGVDPGHPRSDSVVEIAPASTLLLYTDGLVERRGESIDEGLERLRASLERHAHLDVGALLDQLLDDLLGEQLADDVAVLAVRLDPQD